MIKQSDISKRDKRIKELETNEQALRKQVEELLMDRGRRDAKIAVLTGELAKLAKDGQEEYAQRILKASDEAWLNVRREDLVVAHVNQALEQS